MKRHEKTIAAKRRELADMESKQATNSKAREAVESAKAALQIKIDALTSDLALRDQERYQHSSARQKLEKELDDLRKVMDVKSTEDIRRQEADRSREAEMTRLREQSTALQKLLDDQRETAQRLANQLRVDVEGLRTSHTTAQRDLKSAQAGLQSKEGDLEKLQRDIEAVQERRRAIEGELKGARNQADGTERQLKSALRAKEDLESSLREMQDKYNDLEDAVLLIEEEKSDWARRMETTSRQLKDESAKRQHFESELHISHVELASHRNTALEAEREIAKAAGEIKARDAEIALLRSRENKTIVEHVHVLEQAKKVTDRQLAEQVKENSRLNTLMKSIESHRNRIQADFEDTTRQFEMLKSTKSREARSARASMSADDKDLEEALGDERRSRQVAESRIASLEMDLADQRRQFSTISLSVREQSGIETRLARTQDELPSIGTRARKIS